MHLQKYIKNLIKNAIIKTHNAKVKKFPDQKKKKVC